MTPAERTGGPAALLALAVLVGCGAAEDVAPTSRTAPFLVVDRLAGRPTVTPETPGTEQRLEQLRSPGYIGGGEPVAVFFVRHAEQGEDDPNDPQLSETGRERAEALARSLSAVGVTHLYASQFKRTRQTLEPLAKKADLEVEVIRAQEPEVLLSALRSLPPGAVAVVAGHSNTVPGLVCGLGGRPPDLDCTKENPRLEEHEYDRLYLVILPPAGDEGQPPHHTLSLRYGD